MTSTFNCMFYIGLLLCNAINSAITCYCTSCSSNVCSTDLKCYASFFLDTKTRTIIPQRACLKAEDDPKLIEALFCDQDDTIETEFKKCCNESDCNSEKQMPIESVVPQSILEDFHPNTSTINKKYIIIYVGAAIAVTLVTIAISLMLYLHAKKRSKRDFTYFMALQGASRAIKRALRLPKTISSDSLQLKGCVLAKVTPVDLGQNGAQRYHTSELEHPTEQSAAGQSTVSSGAGYPSVMECSISNQIFLDKVIGVGRFGKVFKARWRNQTIAVKAINNEESECALHEAAIYYNCHLRHNNILCFFSIDKSMELGYLQTWLIFDYHENGALCDFLASADSVCSLPPTVLLRNLLISLLSGLDYLHSEILGHEIRKPRIAHRDIKARNIMIKSDFSCCIGDLGLCVVEEEINFVNLEKSHSNDNSSPKHYSSPLDDLRNNLSAGKRAANFLIPNSNNMSNEGNNSAVPCVLSATEIPKPEVFVLPSHKNSLHFSSSTRSVITSRRISRNMIVGTKRYMAPELLELKCKEDILPFEALLKSDIYSLALVMWEILCCFPPHNETRRSWEYVYKYDVPDNPSLEDMRKAIIHNKIRPPQLDEWLPRSKEAHIFQLISECWQGHWEGRPSTGYIHARLHKILTSN